MPFGMIVMHWDDRMGADILAKYPKEASIEEKTLMQIYSQHEYSGDSGIVTLTSGAMNIASYYTGPEDAIYIILLLSSQEDGEVYEDGLADITQQITANRFTESFENLLPSLFQRLSVYPTLNEEQKLAIIFGSTTKRAIIKRLREDVAVSKSELNIWLKDQYREGFFDIENELNTLIKNGIVKVLSIQGQPSDMVFLLEDILTLRIPPKELLKDPVDHHLPESLKSSYFTEVKSFFSNYKPTDEDNIALCDNVFLDPQSYEVYKLLKQAMVTRNDVEKLRKKGVEDVDKTLRNLWEQKLLITLQDGHGNEYYCLCAEIVLKKIYPEYHIDTIKHQYQTRSQNSIVLREALGIIKDRYYERLKEKKELQKAKSS